MSIMLRGKIMYLIKKTLVKRDILSRDKAKEKVYDYYYAFLFLVIILMDCFQSSSILMDIRMTERVS